MVSISSPFVVGCLLLVPKQSARDQHIERLFPRCPNPVRPCNSEEVDSPEKNNAYTIERRAQLFSENSRSLGDELPRRYQSDEPPSVPQWPQFAHMARDRSKIWPSWRDRGDHRTGSLPYSRRLGLRSPPTLVTETVDLTRHAGASTRPFSVVCDLRPSGLIISTKQLDDPSRSPTSRDRRPPSRWRYAPADSST